MTKSCLTHKYLPQTQSALLNEITGIDISTGKATLSAEDDHMA